MLRVADFARRVLLTVPVTTVLAVSFCAWWIAESQVLGSVLGFAMIPFVLPAYLLWLFALLISNAAGISIVPYIALGLCAAADLVLFYSLRAHGWGGHGSTRHGGGGEPRSRVARGAGRSGSDVEGGVKAGCRIRA